MTLERITSHREIKRILTHPDHFHYQYGGPDTPEELLINPSYLYFRVGKGLIYYIVKGYCLEMHAALFPGDLPETPVKVLHKQWDEFAKLGFNTIYTIVDSDNKKACFMCRAIGMKRVKTDKPITIFKVNL